MTQIKLVSDNTLSFLKANSENIELALDSEEIDFALLSSLVSERDELIQNYLNSTPQDKLSSSFIKEEILNNDALEKLVSEEMATTKSSLSMLMKRQKVVKKYSR